MLATSLAFVISNASFYLFSGKFESLALGNYIVAVQQYYVPYVFSTLVYGVVGFGAAKVFKALPVFLSRHKSI